MLTVAQRPCYCKDRFYALLLRLSIYPSPPTMGSHKAQAQPGTPNKSQFAS